MSSLSLAGVTKRYGATTALTDVRLDIEDGEFFTLVGPSGCGKTTTLRTVAGFEDPTEGTVRFGDEDVAGLPPEDRDVGIVFQQYSLFPHMTVEENVAYGLRFTDREDGARVAELLDLVGLAGMRDRDPGELSGGQQQRVALARALAPSPDVLLLDEPMSALDARLRERLRREVRRIQRETGVTTLYVTHDQAEALAVSDRVAVMSEGRVEQVGTPREVYREPATRFVAEFVGENNVFDGTAAGDGVEVGDATFAVEGDTPSGEAVTLCVRPESMRVDAGANTLTGTVDYAEFLGEAVRVGLTWQDREVVVRVDAAGVDRLPETGESLTVGFDPESVVRLDATASDTT
ncbi:ABC transporter ATP-binding protein [Halorarius halobius]|uniref:ABC transporter ATP-binding protein n=1 Tax=Halorarius halobius TaxID=2962671 RepID=UPI0020CEFCC4|nr:ABC transporter ATP-binding protein [Halorarius halobius]